MADKTNVQDTALEAVIIEKPSQFLGVMVVGVTKLGGFYSVDGGTGACLHEDEEAAKNWAEANPDRFRRSGRFGMIPVFEFEQETEA